MNRIMIIGSGGAGKSTLSRKIGEILKIDVFHLDMLHWKPGWVETPFHEWTAIVDGILKKDKWIIDGNYGDCTMEMRFKAADTIIFMDIPRVVCLWRVLKRKILYAGKTRPDMGKGCPEKLDWNFINWIWTYPKLKRPSILHGINKYSMGRRIILLHNNDEIITFLRQIQNKSGC